MKFILEPTNRQNEDGFEVYKLWAESPDGAVRHLCKYCTKQQYCKEYGDEQIESISSNITYCVCC